MIVDLFKGGEYKVYRTTTFFKDYLLLLFGSMGVMVIGLVSASFIFWFNALDLFDTAWFPMVVRTLLIINAAIALFVNTRSHAKELRKIPNVKEFFEQK